MMVPRNGLKSNSLVPWGTRGSRKPILLRYRSSQSFILAVVAVAWFTDMFLYGIIVPVLPMALHQRIGIRDEDRQYWVSILLAVFGASQLVFSLVFGYLSDRIGSRKSFMYVGLLALGASTILLCVGTSIGMFIAGRALQGASAAMVGSVGLALVVDTVPKNQIGRSMGYITIFTCLAQVLSPVLGGLVYARSGYTSVFAMAFGFVGLDLVFRLIMIERHVALQWESTTIQPIGAELQAQPCAERAILDVDASITHASVSNITVNATATAEMEQPMRSGSRPAVALLTSLPFLAALWGICVQATLLTAFDSTLPIYTYDLFGFNSLGGGAVLFAIAVPSLAGPIAGDLSDKFGRRLPATVAFIAAVPLLVLLRLVNHHSLKQIVLLCALLVLLGFILALSIAPLWSEIAHCAMAYEEESSPESGPRKGSVFAQAFGVCSCAFAAGTVIGPIWGGLILSHFGWETMTWTLGVPCIVAAITTSLFVSGTPS